MYLESCQVIAWIAQTAEAACKRARAHMYIPTHARTKEKQTQKTTFSDIFIKNTYFFFDMFECFWLVLVDLWCG